MPLSRQLEQLSKEVLRLEDEISRLAGVVTEPRNANGNELAVCDLRDEWISARGGVVFEGCDRRPPSFWAPNGSPNGSFPGRSHTASS